MSIQLSATMRSAVLASFIGINAISGAAAAEILVTSPTGYTWPKIDLSAFANGNYNFTNGPVSLPGGITFTASPGPGGSGNPNGNSGMGSVIGQGDYGLNGNGTFGGNATYIGVNSGGGYDTLTFSTPVSTFGAYWNYAVPLGEQAWWTDPTISTFTAGGTLIASFDLATLAPISTPGAFNAFEFRGIVDSMAQIGYVEFGGSYLLLAGTPNGSVGGIPEPSTWAMLMIGFAGLGLAGYRASRRGVAAIA